MNCLVAQKLLHLYIDHELNGPEQRSVEAHVTTCGTCRAELVRLERTILAVESLDREPAPGTLYLRTMAQVRSEHRAAHPTRREARASVLSGLGAVVALVGLTLVLFPVLEVLGGLGDLVWESPAVLLDALLGVAASVEAPLLAGSGLLLVAGTLALFDLVRREQPGLSV